MLNDLIFLKTGTKILLKKNVMQIMCVKLLVHEVEMEKILLKILYVKGEKVSQRLYYDKSELIDEE